MRICGACVSLLICVGSQTAHAQSANSWAGFSVALGGGAGRIDQSSSLDASIGNLAALVNQNPNLNQATSQFGAVSGNSSDNDWEGFGTIQAAYDLRFGNIVAGALIDFDFYPNGPEHSSDGDVIGTGVFATNTLVRTTPGIDVGDLTTNVRFNNVWSVGGRLGYLISPKTLLYGLGGYSEASVDNEATLTFGDFSAVANGRVLNVTGQPRSLSISNSELHGFFVGGGGEFLFSDNLALRLEYRYARYKGTSESADFESTSSAINSVQTQGLRVENEANLSGKVDDIEVQSVRAALVMKLGNP